MTVTASTKLARLRSILREHERVLVAFSGGVDSTFLLKVACDELGDSAFALTCVSETMAARESDDARKLGEELGLAKRHHVVTSNELEQPGYAENPTHRCALCKTELMEIATPLAAKLAAHIVLGTVTDDLGDFRPGIEAARSRGGSAPLVEAELSKAEVRELSKQLGLRTWNKPQLACLSSRFPYGTSIDRDRLRRVDTFENALRALGFSEVRVRFHEPIARIELLAEEVALAASPEIRQKIVDTGVALGFTYVALDLKGFRSGSLNEVSLIQLRKTSELARS